MGRKPPEGHIPKPSNCFIIYRKEKILELEARNKQLGLPTRAQQHLSKEASLLWNALPDDHETRIAYRERAEKEKEAHAIRYPGYRLKVARKKGKQRARKGAHLPPPQSLPMHTAAAGSPSSLPDLLPSSTSTSAETTPGPSTPYGGHFSPAGPSQQPQASTQGNRYGPSEAERYQHAMSRYTHQQMLAQDRAFDGQNTAGFSMGPAPRQRTGRAEDVRGQPYAHAAASRRLTQQQPQRLQGSMQSAGNRYAAPQAPADQYYPAPEPVAHGPPAQVMQQRMAMQRPPQAPQPLQMGAEFAQPGAGFYHSAEANAVPTYRQNPPAQLPLGRIDGHHYGLLPDSAYLPMQTELSRSSYAGPARPRAPVANRLRQWNMMPASSYGLLEAEQFTFEHEANNNGLYGPELYEPRMAGTATHNSYGPMEPYVSGATGAATDTARESMGWGYAESFPSAVPPSLPNPSGAFQQSSYVPTNMDYDPAVDDQYALGQGYYEAQAPNASQQLSSADEFPFPGTYDYLGTPPQDTIYREGASSDKSMDALFDWALEYTMDS